MNFARLKLLLVIAAVLVVPFSLRAANRIAVPQVPGLGYLPSLEIRRPKAPFGGEVIEWLRAVRPQWVFVGDSMLGTRIDVEYLGEISSTGKEKASMLGAAATGPSWWYLAVKNWIAPSGVTPRATFIFFRDTNLTDTMFRLESAYGGELDWPAHDLEPELDRLVAARRRGPWARVYSLANRAYELDVARLWMEPAIREWYPHYRYRRVEQRQVVVGTLEEYFAIDHLRKDVASDLEAPEDPDFARDLPSSVLPGLLALAREHHVPICFVRVQRRPVDNKPPDQSPALRKYIVDLKAYIEANGAMFHDDTGDPEMTLDLYEDGDHVLDKRRYTEIFRSRLDSLFRPLTSPGAP